MKNGDPEQVCGCGCGFRTTIQPLLRLHEMVQRAEARAKEENRKAEAAKQQEQAADGGGNEVGFGGEGSVMAGVSPPCHREL